MARKKIWLTLMKTWCFNEEELSEAIEKWKEEFVSSNNLLSPMRVKLIEDSILDLLYNDSSLYSVKESGKTWSFTENSLPLSINTWVQEAEATNHSSALKLASVAGKGILDFFYTEAVLFITLGYVEEELPQETLCVDSDNYSDPKTLQALFYNGFSDLS